MDSKLLLYLALYQHATAKSMTAQDTNDQPAAPVLDGDADEGLLRQLLTMSWEHEVAEGDAEEMQRLIEWAQGHGLESLLPSLSSDALTAQKANESELIVAKAMPIQKAWGISGGNAITEGWISTEDEDQDKDIVPPEAFTNALSGYVSRRMPLSSEHALKSYPIGHGQRVALVRNGQIFAEGTHPTDAAEFEHFPGSGTGVYGRFLINDPNAANAVAKGNVGGFSWVGRIAEYERRTTGRGRIFKQVEPWLESTIAAYPVNTKAVLLATRYSR